MSLKTDIAFAIRNKVMVNFDYNSPDLVGRRRIIPVALGYERKTGRLMVRGYLTGGQSFSRTSPAWRLFRLDRFTGWEITLNKFKVPSGYKKGDKSLRNILAEV